MIDEVIRRLINIDEVIRRFTYYSAPDKAVECEDIRSLYINLARYLSVKIPEGREKALAFTKLEESLSWSIAAIVRPSSIKIPVPVVELIPDVCG